MSSRLLLLWPALVAGLSLLAGCGGGSAGSATSTAGSGGGTGTIPAKAPLGTTQLLIDPVKHTVQVIGSTNPAMLAKNQAVYAGSALTVTQATIAQAPGTNLNQELLSLNIAVNSAYYDPSLGPLRVTFSGLSNHGFSTQALAGSGAAGDTDGGNSASAIGHPFGTWADTDGAIYFTQADSGAIRRIQNGVVTTLTKGYITPTGIVGDANYLYFCDQGANKIYRITKNGISGTVLAGSGTMGFVNGTGAAATFKQPTGIALQGTSLVVADYGNNAIRAVNVSTGATTTFTTGIIGPIGVSTGVLGGQSVIAATGNTEGKIHIYGTSGGSLALTDPAGAGQSGIAVLSDGTIITSNASKGQIRVWEFVPGGSPFAAASYNDFTQAGSIGYIEGGEPKFNLPELLSVVGGTEVVLADSGNNRIRNVYTDSGLHQGSNTAIFTNPDGFDAAGSAVYHTLPGALKVGFSSAATTQFYLSMVVDGPSVVPLSPDPTNGNNFIPSLYPISLAGGSSTATISQDGTGSTARFVSLQRISASASGLQAIADTTCICIGNRDGRVARLTKTSVGSTASAAGFGYDFDPGENLASVCINDAGTVIVATTQNQVVRLQRDPSTDPFVASSWYGSLVAGTGANGLVNGAGNVAKFSQPLCTFGKGTDGQTIYLSDSGNNCIREISLQGSNPTLSTNYKVFTLAGGTQGFVDGAAGAAEFSLPFAITLGTDGGLYVFDALNYAIRRLDMTGTTTTILGGVQGISDGPSGQVSAIYTMDCDAAGNLTFMDIFSGERVIRKLNLVGQPTLTTIGKMSDSSVFAVSVDRSTGDIYWGDVSSYGRLTRIVN